MARIRGRDTAPELRLRKALWHRGLRYRKCLRVSGVRPDIVFSRRRLAIFVDGCFWHGCPIHYVRPRSRSEFWSEKLRQNTLRDRRQTERLLSEGWTVLRFWEHEITGDLAGIVQKVESAIFTSLPLAPRFIVVSVVSDAQDELVEIWSLRELLERSEPREEFRKRGSRSSAAVVLPAKS